ncbi:MAG: sigma-E factor negative regulatory protein [Giesbergeria sp.]
MELNSKTRELLSALADGELQGDELAQALALCSQEGARVPWREYHLIGDVLRAPELARASDSEQFLSRLRGALGEEPAAPVVADLPVVVAPAANDGLFRWKMVAGFASMAAVAAIGWNSLSALRSEAPQGAQLAVVQPAVTTVQTELAQAGAPVMIRDPRLDELLAAHKQYGGASALQLPAGFLRNATFEAPQR